MKTPKYPHIKAYLVALKKKIGLEQQSEKIKTLVVGSSHGQYAYIPHKGEYNLCLPSQDIYYAYCLYKKYCSKLKNLKKVILFYSVFSSGYEVIKTNENYRGYHYLKIFNIKPCCKKYLQGLEEKYNKFLPYINRKSLLLKVPQNYLGKNPDFKGENVGRIGISNPQERALKAFKNHCRSTKQDKYLIKIIQLAKKYHHQFVLVLSPAHVNYKKVLPEAQEIFKNVFQIMKESGSNLHLIDFYQRDVFSDQEWLDYDHLNKSGAKKFTALYHKLERK